ncbi:MAG: transaldolase [Alphaproteobacteria bacterium]|nr:transaldolase [Alphaproteobacteria bacterium]
MRLFIDSAESDRWRRAHAKGWLFGATTNPVILQRAGVPVEAATYAALVEDAKSLGLTELHIQATGSSVDALYRSGLAIAALWERVVVKVPMTEAGLAAAARLMCDGVRVTLTAAYSAQQVVAACAANAAYVAAYFGRLAEAGNDAEAVFERMVRIRAASGCGTRILVASLRSLDQLEMLAAMGHDTFTLTPDLADRLGTDPFTDVAADDFEAARRD